MSDAGYRNIADYPPGTPKPLAPFLAALRAVHEMAATEAFWRGLTEREGEAAQVACEWLEAGIDAILKVVP